MTSTNNLQRGPDQQEEGGREGIINPHSHEQWDIADGFTTSKFLVAIVGVTRIYQEFNSTQTAHEASLEDGQPWTVWGQEADVTPEVGRFFRWYAGGRGLAGDAKISFVGWCESGFHTGPNAYLPHHLYTQHMDPSRARHCCYQCFWQEHGEYRRDLALQGAGLEKSTVVRDHGDLPGNGALRWGVASRSGPRDENQGEDHVEVAGGGA